MTSQTDSFSGTTASAVTGRWIQLALGIICMMTISSPQYVWTLLTKPLMAKLGIMLPSVQVTFTLLVLLQAFFSPFQGALIDRFGPRLLISIGTLLAGLSWVLASYAHSTLLLYLTYGCLGGLGTGIVYVGVVGLMVRWFPDRRGFAAGAVAAGYGMGAIVSTFPISASLAAHGLMRRCGFTERFSPLLALPPHKVYARRNSTRPPTRTCSRSVGRATCAPPTCSRRRSSG